MDMLFILMWFLVGLGVAIHTYRMTVYNRSKFLNYECDLKQGMVSKYLLFFMLTCMGGMALLSLIIFYLLEFWDTVKNG